MSDERYFKLVPRRNEPYPIVSISSGYAMIRQNVIGRTVLINGLTTVTGEERPETEPQQIRMSILKTVPVSGIPRTTTLTSMQ